MATLSTYLLLPGTCHDAMAFYQSCLGGELTTIEVKDSPAKARIPASEQEKIINARLKSRSIDISASDWLRPDRTPVRGNTVCLYLSGGSRESLRSAFEKLSDGAEITDPLREEFFGAYGALNDKFGVRWMFQTDENQ